jgi:hypothetical protein
VIDFMQPFVTLEIDGFAVPIKSLEFSSAKGGAFHEARAVLEDPATPVSEHSRIVLRVGEHAVGGDRTECVLDTGRLTQRPCTIAKTGDLLTVTERD